MPSFTPEQLKRHGLQWCFDSWHWHGRVLSGKYAHWCPEWDDLPIDESCGELAACSCYDEPEFHDAVEEIQRGMDEYNALHPLDESNCWDT